jgi:hypothetical protein
LKWMGVINSPEDDMGFSLNFKLVTNRTLATQRVPAG